MGVVWSTKASRYRRSSRWSEGLPVLLVGGGAKSKPHRDSVECIDIWLKEAGTAGSYLVELPPPDGLDRRSYPADLPDWLAVALGFSLPVVDIPEIRLPHSIEDDHPQPRPDLASRFVGKDQV